MGLPRIRREKARADWVRFDGNNYPYNVCQCLNFILSTMFVSSFQKEVFEAVWDELKGDRKGKSKVHV